MGSGAAESRGFVPLDRLSTQDEDEDEFTANLPEEMGFWRDRYGYGYGDADGGSGTAVASDSESDSRDE
jgi:hypothetical protein